MEWTDTERTGGIVASPAGRVDESNWQVFEANLARSVDRAAEMAGKLVIDLADLEYMSSRGLRVLTLTRRHAETKAVEIVLAAPGEIMREILAISRYDKIFTVAETVERAL